MATGVCGARGVRGVGRGARGGLSLTRPTTNVPSRRSAACQARKKGGDKNVVCNKTVIAKEGSEEEVQELCASYAEDMKANSVGILSFECTKDTHDGKQFHFWERYKNVGYFNENMSSEKTQGFLKDLSPLVEKPVGVSLFEYANGQIGSACVEVGPKGEGGLDDATGANKYGGGARYEQTSTAVQL